MKAAIHSRKSKFTGKGDSIENQIQLCMDYSKSIGIKEFLVYEDEGFSGGNIDRPQFKKMMQDAKDKKFDCLVCYRLDRISRNVSDFSTLIEKLNKLEISFISIKEQFDTSTPMGRAMMFISSVFAQLERETIAERIKDNMYELARSGRWLGGKTPHGFTSKKISFLDENLKERSMYQLEVNDEQMEIVKLIFNKYLELRSLSQLYKYVYHNGIKGPRGGKFDPSSLSGILRNPAYVKANEDILDRRHCALAWRFPLLPLRAKPPRWSSRLCRKSWRRMLSPSSRTKPLAPCPRKGNLTLVDDYHTNYSDGSGRLDSLRWCRL